MKTSGQLVVLGSINADHILNLHHFPTPGETVKGSHYQVAFGGKGANQAVAAGRSGANIAFIACVGDDDTGRQVCQQLSSDNIDIAPISTVAGESTGVALIFVNHEGENVIGIHGGANMALTTSLVEQHQQLIAGADALLMQLESPLASVLAAAQIARRHHTQVILNPAPACPLSDELLGLVDIITPNETEAEILTGIPVTDDASAAQAARVLHAKGIATVIITLGSKGVWLSEQGTGQRVPGFRVNAVDTIAAGDTFNGAMVTGLLEGQSLAQSIRFAHAAAAIAVTRKGAQPSVPWRAEIDAFLQQQG
ncbi:ribokinase [Shimwellia blattae]|uniref:Ribokinase n=1 Tax=Shimwellia blattae (strain ATCC 29907 / DSM 4481 / JCM 1650 / NBRC 105725 / CDC 9005-74) TaxID=630626 RepID=I2BEM6_SHIBC|nr:ribokinase [Shimwellia blattae]AFJ48980.1 ribokinase [Shimwellia blattae DSM 4481 = NBRC 105725]GAB82304.1 ribokinase [Shimwellia blattae DSM 4481 = NBRC 105725]VDY66465.1 Ribokinase [Shimwellia blattae]VEC28350.1 Ribokinase [Shimwellia blattae]